MPVVVPAATISTSWKRAARAAVAIWVLSPISTRKKVTAVVRNTPSCSLLGFSSSSALSGTSAQSAMAMNEAAMTYLNQVACKRLDR